MIQVLYCTDDDDDDTNVAVNGLLPVLRVREASGSISGLGIIAANYGACQPVILLV
jgi:hypothetical protein